MIAMFGLARPRWVCAVLFLTAMTVCLALSPKAANAHAVLMSSSPSQGQRLVSAPNSLTLHFSEAVTRVDATIAGRDGKVVDLPAKVSGKEVRVELSDPLLDGVYAFNWRVMSEDGHPVAAAIVFAVGKSAAEDLPVVAASGWPLPTVIWATKFVYYSACLLGVGGVFFAVWITGGRPGRMALWLLLVAAACGVLLVGLLGVEQTSGSLMELAAPKTWAAVGNSSLTRSVAAAILSLGLALAAAFHPNRGRALSIMSLVLLGVAFAMTGHASGAGVRWVSFTAVSVHVMAVCFWAGALPGLWSTLRGDDRKDALRRFSTAIPWSIAAMAAAGGYLGFVQVGTPLALWDTDYGRVLVLKLAVAATALAFGAWNRLFLTSSVLQGSRSAARKMRGMVTAEIVLVVLVFGVTSVWRFTPPPRALALSAPVETSLHVHDAAAMATVAFEVRPDLVFDAELSLATADFDPLDAQEITLRMSSADGAIAPFDVPVRKSPSGLWSAKHIQVPCDCEWNVDIDILVTDFDLVKLRGKVRLLSGG
jgi:copper transport protein